MGVSRATAQAVARETQTMQSRVARALANDVALERRAIHRGPLSAHREALAARAAHTMAEMAQ